MSRTIVSIIHAVMTLSVIFLLMSCGSQSITSDNKQSGSQSDNTEETSDNVSVSVPGTKSHWHDVLHSDQYMGELEVMFDSSSKVRLRNGEFVSVSGTDKSETPVSALSSVHKLCANANAVISRGIGVDELSLDQLQLQHAKRRIEKGVTREHRDWNNYYKIDISDPDHAEGILAALQSSGLTTWAHPTIKTHDLGWSGVARSGARHGARHEVVVPQKINPDEPTPDIFHLQTYMNSEEESGGFNVLPAWDLGIHGQGVTITDSENNWNFDHEDLPIDLATSLLTNEEGLDPEAISSIHHGSAVVGILAGQENEYGVRGMAVDSNVKLITGGVGLGTVQHGETAYQIDGTLPPVFPGDVFLIEVGVYNPARTPNGECVLDMETQTPNYCTLLEALPIKFGGIQTLTDLGYIVVEGAANGGADLSERSMYWGHCYDGPCPPEEESGAIIVAASHSGHDHTRPWWSNFGARVHAYGWGYDVTSSGYGFDLNENFESQENDSSVPGDPNRSYTNSFNGTSSAAAQVAGAIALVQSFAKQHYRPMVPESRSAYLNAGHMHELIRRTGTPGTSSGMGKKPDVGAMIDIVAQTEFIPELAMHNGMPFPKSNVVAGIRYDMDKDGRAELITFEPGTTSGIWKVDLSGTGASDDGYGAWDMTITMPLEYSDGNYFPVVNDYDSDEDADLAVYDNKHGLWYIYYTGSETFELGLDVDANWSEILDYSADPNWHEFARALPGDFDGDNFLDLAIMRADGMFSIDHGGIGHLEKQGNQIVYIGPYGEFDRSIQVLSDDQLAAAPGWAYLPVVMEYAAYDGRITEHDLVLKSVNNLDGVDKLSVLLGSDFSVYREREYAINLLLGQDTAMVPFGGYEDIPTALWLYDYGLTKEWKVTDPSFHEIEYFPYPDNSEMSLDCYPVPGNYDGEGISDFALKCANSWQIAYYNYSYDAWNGTSDINFREEDRFELLDSPYSLPPNIYAGGLSYEYMRDMLESTGLFDYYIDKDPFSPYTVRCIREQWTSFENCLAQ